MKEQLFFDTSILIIWVAFLLDLLIGDPVYSWHPIRIIGNKIIKPIENFLWNLKLNTRLGGMVLAILTILISGSLVFILNIFFADYLILSFLLNIYLIYSCIALKDLKFHVERVIKSLQNNNLEQARKDLSLIVSRDTQNLDNQDIAKACIETLAENLSDGVIAPLFYAFLGGSFLAVIYKAANTMDSMLGYKNEKYKNFGFFPAKLDDILNFIPSRLSFIFIIFAGKKYLKTLQNWTKAFKIGLKNRVNHDSPNAGHPEAAIAAILDIKLGGPVENKFKPNYSQKN